MSPEFQESWRSASSMPGGATASSLSCARLELDASEQPGLGVGFQPVRVTGGGLEQEVGRIIAGDGERIAGLEQGRDRVGIEKQGEQDSRGVGVCAAE